MRSAALALLIAAAPALAAPPARAPKVSAQPVDADDELVPPRNLPPATQKAPEQSETPWILRWMLRPRPRGLMIRLPIMDTDPNRGITAGIMPIWVLQGEHDDRIRQIHAPSLTYNANFKVTPTYRYYYYPQEDAALIARASWSKYEREALGQYEDNSVLGTEHDLFLRVQYNVDAGQRFYGFGPDAPKNGEANYKEDYWQTRWGIGTPLPPGSRLRAHLSQHYQSGRIINGPLPNLPLFSDKYPGQFSDLRQQITETRISLDFDSRDHPVTTSRGIFAQAYQESSVRGFMSAYDYQRYGLDGRWFKPWPSDETKVFAVQARYEQLTGAADPPFWVMPRMGGKYSLRAYGEGRYVDRGAATLNVEQRISMAEEKMAGVTTEFQLAPFVGVGEVFSHPGKMTSRYARPVLGAALRAVAKPQVVGSVDFGVGREGLSVFMDINYSF